MAQPPVAAAPLAGPRSGPIWTTRNVAFGVEGCLARWTRDFSFSVGPGGDPAVVDRFLSEFAGQKRFQVDLTRISRIERTPAAPNTLAGVEYALGEIIFRGEGILSGGDTVEMSGIIVGDENVRVELLARLEERRSSCAGR